MLEPLSQSPDAHAVTGDRHPTPASGLRVCGISKAYDRDRPIIGDFSADIQLGEAVAIVGASGSGKSTLLHIMAGLIRPDAGQVHVLGEICETQAAWDRARARCIGYVFQDSFLLSSLTVFDNLVMPMIGVEPSSERRRERALHLLDRLGLSGKVSTTASKLSGGERQRVAIARAVVNRPRIIVADEPTGNLDFEATRLVIDLLHDLRREVGASLIIATHDPAVAATCDRHFAFRNGAIEDRSVAQ